MRGDSTQPEWRLFRHGVARYRTMGTVIKKPPTLGFYGGVIYLPRKPRTWIFEVLQAPGTAEHPLGCQHIQLGTAVLCPHRHRQERGRSWRRPEKGWRRNPCKRDTGGLFTCTLSSQRNYSPQQRFRLEYGGRLRKVARSIPEHTEAKPPRKFSRSALTSTTSQKGWVLDDSGI